MPRNSASEPRLDRPASTPRISTSSPPYYLGRPAQVWLAAMSSRKRR